MSESYRLIVTDTSPLFTLVLANDFSVLTLRRGRFYFLRTDRKSVV